MRKKYADIVDEIIPDDEIEVEEIIPDDEVEVEPIASEDKLDQMENMLPENLDREEKRHNAEYAKTALRTPYEIAGYIAEFYDEEKGDVVPLDTFMEDLKRYVREQTKNASRLS